MKINRSQIDKILMSAVYRGLTSFGNEALQTLASDLKLELHDGDNRSINLSVTASKQDLSYVISLHRKRTNGSKVSETSDDEPVSGDSEPITPAAEPTPEPVSATKAKKKTQK